MSLRRLDACQSSPRPRLTVAQANSRRRSLPLVG